MRSKNSGNVMQDEKIPSQQTSHITGSPQNIETPLRKPPQTAMADPACTGGSPRTTPNLVFDRSSPGKEACDSSTLK